MIFWVLPLFSMGSQSVIVTFPKGYPSSQSFPPDVPNSTSVLPLMVCPKFNSHVCKRKRLPIEGAHFFLFFDLGSKEVLLLGSAQCSKNFGDSPINIAPSKTRK